MITSILYDVKGSQLFEQQNSYEEMTKFVQQTEFCPLCNLPANMKPRTKDRYIKRFECLAGHRWYYDDYAQRVEGDGYNFLGHVIATDPHLDK